MGLQNYNLCINQVPGRRKKEVKTEKLLKEIIEKVPKFGKRHNPTCVKRWMNHKEDNPKKQLQNQHDYISKN